MASTGTPQVVSVVAGMPSPPAGPGTPGTVPGLPLTPTQAGLGNVTNDAQVKRSEMGSANGVASLDGTGLVPTAQLPPATPSSPGSMPNNPFVLNGIVWHAIGDSVTQGNGAGSPTVFDAWAYRLAAKLGFALVNVSIGGSVVMPATGHAQVSTQVDYILGVQAMPSWLQPQGWSGTPPSPPNLVTWCLGPNDYTVANPIGDFATVMGKSFASLDQTLSFAEAVRYNLERLVTGLPPTTKIIVIEMFQNTYADGLDFQYNNMQNAIAQAMGIEVVPVRKSSGMWAHNTVSGLWNDSIHPSAIGHERIARYMQRYLIGGF